MNEVRIRRIFFRDELWERTSLSWKALKPLRNFEQSQITDESIMDCYIRLNREFDIPVEVIEQWIYLHYYDENSVNNYGWIDYHKCLFRKVELDIATLQSINIVKAYESRVRIMESLNGIEEFMCVPKDKKNWEHNQTWRVPPIFMDVNSFPTPPDYSEITAPFQLIEGHTRLGLLFCLYKKGFLKKNKHTVYLLSMINEHS